MPTFREIRQRFGREMRAFQAGTTPVDPAVTQTTAGLIDNTWPLMRGVNGQVTGTPDMNVADLFEGYFLLRPWAGFMPGTDARDRVRQIAPGDYAPLTGTLTVDQTYINAPQAGEPYELHGYGINPWDDVLDFANETLRRIPLRVEFVYTPLAGDREHDLTAQQPWLRNPDHVYQIGSLGQNNVQVQAVSIVSAPLVGSIVVSYRGYRSAAITIGGRSLGRIQTDILAALQSMPYLAGVTVSPVTVGATYPPTYTGTIGGIGFGFISQTLSFTVTMQDVTGPTPLLLVDTSGMTAQYNDSPVKYTVPGIATVTEQAARSPLSRLHGDVYQDGDRVIAATPSQSFNVAPTTGDRLYVTAKKWAYHHCAPSRWDESAGLPGLAAVYGDVGGQSGLLNDGTECVPDAEWVVAGMVIVAWDRYPQILDPLAQQRRATNLQAAHLRWQRLTREHWREPARTMRPLEDVLNGGSAGHHRFVSR